MFASRAAAYSIVVIGLSVLAGCTSPGSSSPVVDKQSPIEIKNKISDADFQDLENELAERWAGIEANCNCSGSVRTAVLGAFSFRSLSQRGYEVEALQLPENQKKIEKIINYYNKGSL